MAVLLALRVLGPEWVQNIPLKLEWMRNRYTLCRSSDGTTGTAPWVKLIEKLGIELKRGIATSTQPEALEKEEWRRSEKEQGKSRRGFAAPGMKKMNNLEEELRRHF